LELEATLEVLVVWPEASAVISALLYIMLIIGVIGMTLEVAASHGTGDGGPRRRTIPSLRRSPVQATSGAGHRAAIPAAVDGSVNVIRPG
jgi:hypothetical protein